MSLIRDEDEIVALKRSLDMLPVEKRMNMDSEVVLGFHKLNAMAEPCAAYTVIGGSFMINLTINGKKISANETSLFLRPPK